MPDELRGLLPHCSGVDVALDVIDFVGRFMGGGFRMESIFPKNIPIAHDGFGNYWVLDVAQADAARTPVFFACHDAPVILYQSDSIAEFSTLDERFIVVDLRGARPGLGFSWGRYGPRTEVRRHGDLPVFAYAAPPKRSLWSRLTGR